MQCPKCGTETAEGKRFCRICGSSLTVQAPSAVSPIPEEDATNKKGGVLTCPKCGSTITAGRPFCGRCGAALGISQQAHATSPLPSIAPARPPARIRKPINWRKVGLVVGIPVLLVGVGIAAWHFWPRVLLPPEKIGTLLDRATAGQFLNFNEGAPGRKILALSTGSDVWDLSTRESIYSGPSLGYFLSPDGQTTLQYRSDGTYLYDWATKKSTALENPLPQWVSSSDGSTFANVYTLISFSSKGDLIAAARRNGSLQLLNSLTGKVTYTLREGGNPVSEVPNEKVTCIVNSLAFTSDGAVLASGELNGNISLWNTKTGDLLATLSDQDRQPCDASAPQSLNAFVSVLTVTFSPGGQLLAAQDNEGIVRVWQVSSRKLIYTLPYHLGPAFERVRFSPDGNFLVTSGAVTYGRQSREEYELYLVWDAANGSLLRALESSGRGTFDFSSDGNLFTAQLWKGRVKVESWALRSRFRFPFVSSGKVQVVPSDTVVLEAYEEQAARTLEYFQQSLGRYMGVAERGTFPQTLQDISKDLGVNKEDLREDNRGYHFQYSPGPSGDHGHITSYVVSARPLLYQQTGTRSFTMDQTGQVHATEEAREATASDPLFRSFQDLTQASATAQSPPPAQNVPPAQTNPAPQVHGASTASTAAEVNQLLSRAENQFGQGDYRGALQSCDAALRVDPNNARGKQLKAKVESTMKVLGSKTASSPLNITPAAYFGVWNKVDPGGMIRVIIYGSADKPRVHILAACSPNPCDQGEEDAFWDGNRLTATFRRPPTITDYRLALDQNANLQLNCRFRNSETKVDQPCVTMSYTKARP